MKLSRLKVEHFQGLRALDISPAAPVLLVAGGNHAGKSSLIEAIRCAFRGAGERVHLKKDLGELVTEGAKSGHISVWMDGEPIAGLKLPSGEHTENLPADITLPKLFAVLRAQAFADMTGDERRQLLFDITGCRITPAVVRERLIARGATEKHVEAVLPLLRAGFPAAVKDATDRAKDAKGAWRGVTGEAYGEKKAEGWTAQKPDVDAALETTLQDSLAEIDARLSTANQRIGELRAQQRAAEEWEGKREGLSEKAGMVERIRAKLTTDEAELASWNQKVAQAEAAAAMPSVCNCPSCDVLLELRDGALAVAGEHSADPALAAKLEEYTRARDSYSRAVENDRRDLAEAEAAAAQLAEVGAVVDAAALTLAQQEVTDLQRGRAEVNRQLNDLRLLLSQAANAERKTQEAAQHHADALAWALIAAALSPDGIPGEVLAEALTPFNDLLHSLSKAADWKRVQVSADMEITASGRAYRLLSESEHWRCDAVLALAIANLSGIRFVMLDRFDVLQVSDRGALIGLLDFAVDEKLIDSAVIAGTMKAAPTGLSENFHPIWMEDGMAVEAEQKKVA